MFNSIIKEIKGQAMTEFCVAAPLLVLFLYSMIYMSDMYVVKHKTLHASRYTAWIAARNDNLNLSMLNASAEDIYFPEPQYQENVEIVTGSSADTNYFEDEMDDSVLWEHMQVIVDFLKPVMKEPRTAVEVTYSFPAHAAGIDLTDFVNAPFEINSSHVVDGDNSWDGCHTDINDLAPAIETIIKDEVGNPFEDVF